MSLAPPLDDSIISFCDIFSSLVARSLPCRSPAWWAAVEKTYGKTRSACYFAEGVDFTPVAAASCTAITRHRATPSHPLSWYEQQMNC